MSKTTVRIMNRIERKLEKVLDLHVTACGHEDLMDKADRSLISLLRFTSAEIEKLVQKAGAE